MDGLKKLELEIDKIQERNRKVEADKNWETSKSRKWAIAILTYSVIALFFHFAGFPKPLVNAIVPTIGFLLSTLTLGVVKKVWIKKYYPGKSNL